MADNESQVNTSAVVWSILGSIAFFVFLVVFINYALKYDPLSLIMLT